MLNTLRKDETGSDIAINPLPHQPFLVSFCYISHILFSNRLILFLVLLSFLSSIVWLLKGCGQTNPPYPFPSWKWQTLRYFSSTSFETLQIFPNKSLTKRKGSGCVETTPTCPLSSTSWIASSSHFFCFCIISESNYRERGRGYRSDSIPYVLPLH